MSFFFFTKIFLLLIYNWPTVLYQFQAYNIVMQYFYTLWKDHQDKSSYYSLIEYTSLILTPVFSYLLNDFPSILFYFEV